jgi:hypothetical protein
MYLIANADDSPMRLWRRVERLRDFKAKDGQKYLVRKTLAPIDFSTIIPIYIGNGDRLKRSNESRTGWIEYEK